MITAPATVEPGQSFPASVPDMAGVSYVWTVTNGAVTAGSGTRQVTILAGETGPVSVEVTETVTATGCVSAQGSVTIPVAILATGYYTVTPCRLFDTRFSDGPAAGAPILGPGETRTFSVGTRCGLTSSTIRSLSVNQTVTAQTADGELVLFRGDLGSVPSRVPSATQQEDPSQQRHPGNLSRWGRGVHGPTTGPQVRCTSS